MTQNSPKMARKGPKGPGNHRNGQTIAPKRQKITEIAGHPPKQLGNHRTRDKGPPGGYTRSIYTVCRSAHHWSTETTYNTQPQQTFKEATPERQCSLGYCNAACEEALADHVEHWNALDLMGQGWGWGMDVGGGMARGRGAA